MKRRIISILAVLAVILVSGKFIGCGGGSGSDPTGNPEVNIVKFDNGIWVSDSDGNDSNAGTVDLPVKTIAKGIELAKAEAKDVYIIEGTYKEDVEVTGSVGLYGGFGPLVNGERAHDTAQYITVIDGSAVQSKVTFTGKSNTMPFNYALFVNNSDSVVDGLKINGDLDGAVVYIRNSSATISNSIVSETDPVAQRKTTFGIVATIDGSAVADYTVNVKNSSINMYGTGSDNDLDFGFLAIPEKDADRAIQVNFNNNSVVASGKSHYAMAVFAADDQDFPVSSSKIGDGKASISLQANQNRFNMNTESEMLTAILASGIGFSNSILPTTEKDFYLAGFEAVGNYMKLSSESFSVGISGMNIRDEALVANNVIDVDNSTSGGAGIIFSNSKVNIYYNTINEKVKNGSYGIAFFTTEGASQEYQLYSNLSPQNVYNNIINIIADPSCNQVAGILETADDEAMTYYSSPKEFKNNDIYVPIQCAGITALYVDLLGHYLINNPSDLNDESKFDPANITVFDGNISVDPQFTDSANGDLTLLTGSPAIDSGLNFEDGWKDVLGTSRPVGSGVDMGAIEQ